MKILSKISPAETLLIRYYDSVELKDLMKYTFMDLLFKKVIEIKEVTKKAHPRDKRYRKYTYVITGKNFSDYKPKHHEFIYLSLFQKNSSIQIIFRSFIKMAYKNADGSWNYEGSIKSNLTVALYFKESFFTILFRRRKLTESGLKLKEDLSKYFRNLNKVVINLLLNDKQKALELLLSIGGNIFLLKNLDFQLLKKIDSELLNQERAKYKGAYDIDSDWWLYLDFFEDFHAFDIYFDNFDDLIDSFEAEFESSACSSWDDGCSSCTSCGGCGGCD